MQIGSFQTVVIGQTSTPAATGPAAPAAAPVASSADTLGTGAPSAASTGAPGSPTGNPQQGPAGFSQFLPIMAIMLVGMIAMSMMTSRREKKRRENLMNGMKKYDRVLTIGGIIGTVAEIRDNEIVLITDESTRSRIHVTRASIQQVLQPSDKTDSSTQSASQADIKVTTKGERATV